VFIARISRGRTIREFVLGVLIAPSLFTMIWFAVLGASGIALDERLGGTIGEAAAGNAAVALFEFLGEYPLALLTSLLAIFLVWIFFVAGADAGTIVLGSMSAGGALNPRTRIKLTWGAIMAGVAAILLLAGGLDAIQQAQILVAAPFGILMIAIAIALQRALRHDYREERRQLQEAMAYDQDVEKRQMDEFYRHRTDGDPVGQPTSVRDE
jgi:glycine betaine transporter